MAAVTICSDFGAQKKSDTVSTVSPYSYPIFLFKYFDAYAVPGTVPGAMLDKKYSSE